MELSTWWWVATGVLITLELLTGTFYLLMLAVGATAGALAAHAGASPATQWIVGSLLGGTAVVVSYLVRRRRPGDRRQGVPRRLHDHRQPRQGRAPVEPRANPGF